MTFFRRRLRLWAAVWFLFQGASLSAIVPRDCCATHRGAAHHEESIQRESGQQPDCHKAVPAPASTTTPDNAQCPMRGADGTPCPMHRNGHGTHGANGMHADHAEHATHVDTSSTRTSPSTPACTLRAICDGPMAALVVLLVQPGVLPNRAAFTVDLHVDAAPPETPARLIHGLVSPDLPPPRA